MAAKYLIWDFDGTLFDSYPHILRAFRRALALHGFPNADPGELEARVRISIGTAASYYTSRYGLDPDALLKTYHAEENGKDDGDVRPFAGIRDLLFETMDAGWHHFLYTHRGLNVFAYLDRENVRGCFEDFVTAADGFPSKPEPDAILYLVGKHGLPPADTWMIGDRLIDVQAGKNAGIQSLLFDPVNRITDPEGFEKVVLAEEIRKRIER
ncbi:MAG: HAD-IA family hydrolase [Clostridia bacterium]|nr:HAD-IA family hydrolase [Clostridia bacterium]